METLKVSKYSGNPTAELFQILKFKDVNGDRVIDKKSVKDEGYLEEADLNRDGKILFAEAKYYYQTLFIRNKISVYDTQFSINEKEIETLVRESLLLKSNLLKSRNIFMEAIAAARLLLDKYRSEAIVNLVETMTKSGLHDDALELARTIGDTTLKTKALTIVASARAQKSE
jgi:hypothetical protein